MPRERFRLRQPPLKMTQAEAPSWKGVSVVAASSVILNEVKDLAAAVLAAVMVFSARVRQITRHKNAARALSPPAAPAQDDPSGSSELEGGERCSCLFRHPERSEGSRGRCPRGRDGFFGEAAANHAA